MATDTAYWFMYMDESGDDGANTARSHWFCQSCIALPMKEWHRAESLVLDFRRTLSKQIGLGVRREIHASEIDRCSGAFSRPQLGRLIEAENRFQLICDILDFINSQLPFTVVNCYIDKRSYLGKNPRTGVRELALDRILNRFRVMWYKEESSNLTVIIHDDGAEGGVRRAVRKLKRYNWITNKSTGLSENMPIDYILEDPMFEASKHNRFLQLTDIVCYALRGHYQSFGRLAKFPQQDLLGRLENVLVREASSHALGVVEVQ